MHDASIYLNTWSRPAKSKAVSPNRMRRLERLADQLDNKWRIPVVGWRVGWDQVLGLIPVAGDTLALLLSSYLIYQMLYLKPPKMLLARMGLNLLIDWAVGSIPILGNVFDLLFPANQRNVRLLKKWLESERQRALPLSSSGSS